MQAHALSMDAAPGIAARDSVVLTLDPDRADLDACLRGESGAYARIVRRYEQEIARQLWRFTRERNELEDMVHDVFVEAYTSLRTYRFDAPFLHWLRRIATRVGYRHWRRRERETRIRGEANFNDLPAPEETTPSEAAEYLFRVFGLLPAADRLVLTLHYFEGCDTDEIAARTGWSRALVKVRAFRARKRLKSLMEQAGFGR